MPLCFKATENGNYTVSVDPENVEMGYLHLIDNKTGTDVDLLVQPSYTFEARITDYTSRFKLVFVSGCEDTDGDNAPFAFFSNGNWIIANEGKATLQVIDVSGRILTSETISGSVSKAIEAPSGVYLIRLMNGETIRTQKVLVK